MCSCPSKGQNSLITICVNSVSERFFLGCKVLKEFLRYNHYVKLDLGEVGYKTHYKGLGAPRIKL